MKIMSIDGDKFQTDDGAWHELKTPPSAVAIALNDVNCRMSDLKNGDEVVRVDRDRGQLVCHLRVKRDSSGVHAPKVLSETPSTGIDRGN